MAGKVERDLRGKSGVLTGDGEDRNRPSPNPSRKRKGSKTGGDVRSRNANPLMPGLRLREDGWTAPRARRFLAELAQSGCVPDAARAAGLSPQPVKDARARFAGLYRPSTPPTAGARRAAGGRA